MKKYKLVLFDFDGTLADSFNWFLQISEHVTERFRLKAIESEDIDRLRTLSARQMIQLYRVPAWKMLMMSRFVHRRMKEDIHQIRLFDGMDTLLRSLHGEGIRLAVVSSNSPSNIRTVLGPLADLFEQYECGVSLFGKAAKFVRVLKRARVRPDEAICIGDEIRDLEAARLCGLDFGAVSWGYTLAEALRQHHPTYLYASVSEMMEQLTTAPAD